MNKGNKNLGFVPSNLSSLLVKHLLLHITLHVSESYKSGVLV